MEEVVPLAASFLCSFHCRQNIMKKCGGGTGQSPLSAMWMYNLLIGCKSVTSLSATRKQYEEKIIPQTTTTSLEFLKKCNSQPQGVLRAILFACMAKVHLRV
jgi:hypothetical protein